MTMPMPRSAAGTSRAATLPRVAPALEHRLAWQRRYRQRLRLTDLAVVMASVGIAALVPAAWVAEAGPAGVVASPWQDLRVSLVTATIWLTLLAVVKTRDESIVGHGTSEYRRVIRSTALSFGILAIGFVLLQTESIRAQLLVALPVGMASLVVGRRMSRRWLVHQREVGEFVSRAVIAGTRADVEYVAKTVIASGMCGYRVLGVVLDGDPGTSIVACGQTIRALGTMDTVAHVAEELGADAVIIASTRHDDPDYIKRLAWQLEGSAAELVLSSPLADVAGPRMTLQPIEGLPLVHVAIPTFEGGRYALKRTMDIAISATALLAIAIFLPIIALAIKIDSRGDVFFRQDRVGRDGRIFKIVKFRSMCVDAEARQSELANSNEGAGLLFKMKSDPRVTHVGAFLRRYSIDELPQFWNVLVGDMSVVGPRPPLVSEVQGYDGTVYRRLYIKPGITGLWQVSGRSDLSWDESVRLDLRYVENWSVTNDLLLICRTVKIMLRPEGAY
jgi:exopolysaccharide biosynthesis polyprenyl glycosylphosphotransferase